MQEIRAELPSATAETTVMLAVADGESQWWTFGRDGANASRARPLSDITRSRVTNDSLALQFDLRCDTNTLEAAVRQIREQDPAGMLSRRAGTQHIRVKRRPNGGRSKPGDPAKERE